MSFFMEVPDGIIAVVSGSLIAGGAYNVRMLHAIDKRLSILEDHFNIPPRKKMKIAIPFFAICALLFVTGCDPSPLQPSEQVETHTITIPEQKLETLAPDGSKVVTIVPASTVQRDITNTVWRVSPQWETTIKTAETINGATAPINPFAAPIALAMGGLSAILGWIARVKSKKATLTDVLIEAVEKANDANVKAVIRDTATKWGVQSQLQKEVKANT